MRWKRRGRETKRKREGTTCKKRGTRKSRRRRKCGNVEA